MFHLKGFPLLIKSIDFNLFKLTREPAANNPQIFLSKKNYGIIGSCCLHPNILVSEILFGIIGSCCLHLYGLMIPLVRCCLLKSRSQFIFTIELPQSLTTLVQQFHYFDDDDDDLLISIALPREFLC